MSAYSNSPRHINDFDGADSSEMEDEKETGANVSDEGKSSSVVGTCFRET